MDHMKHFKQLVKELPAKKVVFTFGRFQPPTIGHGLLVTAVKHIAQKQGADHVIYASRSQDKKSNPLPVDRKVYYLKRMFPGAKFVGANEQVRTFMEAAKELNKKYKNLVMVAGSDRVPEYKKLLEKYNGKDFHFDTIEVVSAGERDPDADGASGMSGTKMRDAAKKGDFDSFKRGLPSTLTTVDAKRLMNEIREGMGLEVIREKVELQTDSIREAYHAGNIFNVDDIVESAGIVYKIQKRGSNHLLLLDESGNLVSKWLQDVVQTTKEFTLLEGLTEMKYTGTDKIKVARVIANALGLADVEKSSNPEMLINNALRKVRNKPMRPEYIEVLHKMLQTAQEAGIAYDEKLVPQKVAEGVKQPNGTDKVGGVIAELSPETLKSYIPKAMGNKSAADFQRGVKMAQGAGGTDELQKKSDKRSTGIHAAIKKLAKEETELEEGKVGELHDTISRHLDKHISDFKGGHTGMDQFGSKVLAAHKSVAKEHGLEHKHAAKMVNDYVDSKLDEEVEQIDEIITKPGAEPPPIRFKDIGPSMRARDQLAGQLLRQKQEQEKEAQKKSQQNEEVSDLLEQIATAAMMGKDTTELKKKLSATRHDIKNTESDHEAERQLEPIEKKIGHTITAAHETDAVRKMKIRYQTESVENISERWVKKTINGVTHYFDAITGQQVSQEEVDLEEDQATAEYKVKTYYDNNQGKTVTRKVRPHKVTFSASKKNAEPEVDEPGEKLTKEAFAGTTIPGANISTKYNKVKEGIVGVPAGDMGAMPAGAPDAYSGNPSIITKDAKDKLRDKNALKLKEEQEDEHEEDISDDELDSMADTVTDLDDVIDAYDDDELHLVDDDGEYVGELEEPEEVKEETLNEVLSRTERIRAKIRFAQSKAKRERKIKIALKTPSSMTKLNGRARKLAVKLMKQRIARKPLASLSTSEKERVEAIVAKRKKLIDRLAMKLVSRVKKIEQQRLHHSK